MHRLTLPGLACLLAWLAPTGLTTAEPPAAVARSNSFHEFLSAAHDRGQFNGNVLVTSAGADVYRGSFGMRHHASGDALDADSVFRLASVSKQFTAMGIMILKEQGKLSLDQDIRDFIPELPYEGVTVRHLVHHQSGLPDYTRLMHEHWMPDLEYRDAARLVAGNDQIIEALATHQPEPHFAPGERWEYSNTGYMLLATIVARASGKPFEVFLKEEIFEPAQMTSTVVYEWSPGIDDAMPDRVFGYSRDLGGSPALNDAHFLNGAQGDGGIYSTLDDLARWDRILYTERLVSRDAMNEAFTPGVLRDGEVTDYGFGWAIGASPSGGKVVQHAGGWVGFTTYIYREIDEDRCLIVLTNDNASSRYFGGILRGLIGLMHGETPVMPKLAVVDRIGPIALREGGDRARAEYARLKAEHPDDYTFDERSLNLLGYGLLEQDDVDAAVAIFRLNLEEYPESANCHDSLADGLRAQGDLEGALSHYRAAVSMDAEFPEAEAKLAEVEAALARRLNFKHSVRAIHEDRSGNFWFGGHQDGLARFDGERLTYFTTDDRLCSNQIRRIVEGADGTVWFEGATGVSAYDGKQLVTHTLDFAPTNTWRLKAGDLWFKESGGHGVNGMEGQPGAYRYDGSSFTFHHYPLPIQRRADTYYATTGLNTAPSGRVWFATYGAVIGYDGASFEVYDNERLGLTEDSGYLHARCVFEDSRGRVWIGNNGIGVILIDGETVTHFTQQQGVGRRDRRSGGKSVPRTGDAPPGEPSMHRVFAIGEDAAGNIWFGTIEQGVWRYDGTSLVQFTSDDGLGTPSVESIYTDRRGDLWVGGTGVYRFNGTTFDRMH